MRKKYGWVDGLKGISIIMVVVLHTGGEVLPSYFGSIAHCGGNGVQMFFIISAFLSYKSLEYFFDNHKYNLKNILIWLGKKYLRLFILYYIACIMSILIVGGTPFWYGETNYLSAGNILSHVTFTHGVFPRYCNSFIGVEWYLGALMIFYLITPLLYKIINSSFRSVSLFLIIAAASFYLRIYFLDNLPLNNYNFIYYSYHTTFSFMTQMPVWILGIVLYHVIKLDEDKAKEKLRKLGISEENEPVPVWKIVVGLLLFVIGTALSIYQACTTNELLIDNKILLFGIWFTIVCIGLSLYSNFIVDNPLFRVIGKYSYGVYLLHPVVYRVYEQYRINVGDESLNWLIEFGITVIISMILSVVITKCIDDPIQKLIKRGQKNAEQK